MMRRTRGEVKPPVINVINSVTGKSSSADDCGIPAGQPPARVNGPPAPRKMPTNG